MFPNGLFYLEFDAHLNWWFSNLPLVVIQGYISLYSMTLCEVKDITLSSKKKWILQNALFECVKGEMHETTHSHPALPGARVPLASHVGILHSCFMHTDEMLTSSLAQQAVSTNRALKDSIRSKHPWGLREWLGQDVAHDTAVNDPFGCEQCPSDVGLLGWAASNCAGCCSFLPINRLTWHTGCSNLCLKESSTLLASFSPHPVISLEVCMIPFGPLQHHYLVRHEI